MRIEVGQDARGRWAWMILDDRGRLIVSDDDYWEAALAMQDAAHHLELHQRSARRKGHKGAVVTRREGSVDADAVALPAR